MAQHGKSLKVEYWGCVIECASLALTNNLSMLTRINSYPGKMAFCTFSFFGEQQSRNTSKWVMCLCQHVRHDTCLTCIGCFKAVSYS